MPDFAILLTNGDSELFLAPNAGKFYLKYTSIDGNVQVSTEVTEEEARRMRADFEKNAIGDGGKFKSAAKRISVQPHGDVVTWTADKRKLTAYLTRKNK